MGQPQETDPDPYTAASGPEPVTGPDGPQHEMCPLQQSPAPPQELLDPGDDPMQGAQELDMDDEEEAVVASPSKGDKTDFESESEASVDSVAVPQKKPMTIEQAPDTIEAFLKLPTGQTIPVQVPGWIAPLGSSEPPQGAPVNLGAPVTPQQPVLGIAQTDAPVVRTVTSPLQQTIQCPNAKKQSQLLLSEAAKARQRAHLKTQLARLKRQLDQLKASTDLKIGSQKAEIEDLKEQEKSLRQALKAKGCMCVSAKKERSIRSFPDPPMSNGYSLFSAGYLRSAQADREPPRNRMTKCGEAWRDLTGKEKDLYNEMNSLAKEIFDNSKRRQESQRNKRYRSMFKEVEKELQTASKKSASVRRPLEDDFEVQTASKRQKTDHAVKRQKTDVKSSKKNK